MYNIKMIEMQNQAVENCYVKRNSLTSRTSIYKCADSMSVCPSVFVFVVESLVSWAVFDISW